VRDRGRDEGALRHRHAPAVGGLEEELGQPALDIPEEHRFDAVLGLALPRRQERQHGHAQRGIGGGELAERRDRDSYDLGLFHGGHLLGVLVRPAEARFAEDLARPAIPEGHGGRARHPLDPRAPAPEQEQRLHRGALGEDHRAPGDDVDLGDAERGFSGAP